MPTKLFLLAGEASGDLHGSNLIKALKAEDGSISLVGMGGPRMAEAGMTVAKDLDGMQVVGFYEVLRHIGFFRKVFNALLDRMVQEKPDAVVCIDYPGFNLRFAAEAHRRGVPVFYYIAPQVWAWHASRARTMARIVDRAFVIFDFEAPIFERAGLKAEFVGHPLVDCLDGALTRERARGSVMKEVFGPEGVGEDRVSWLVALMPGSRPGEILRHFRPFLSAVDRLGDRGRGMAFVVSDADGCIGSRWAIETHSGPKILHDLDVPDRPRPPIFPASSSLVPVPVLARAADFAVVVSGTATLETALSGCPMAVVYRGSWISYAIAHQLVELPVISLVNIVLGRHAFPELIQGECNPDRLAEEIVRGVHDRERRRAQIAALEEIPGRLGGPGASRRTAQGILRALRK